MEYTFQILTPMFLSGANREIAELREASIKGLLRYWWRTLHGNLSAKELYEKEIQIFGGGGDNAKKSPIRIRILNEQNVRKKLELQEKEKQLPQKEDYKVCVKKDKNGKDIKINILEYLAYGTYEYQKDYLKGKNILNRSYFQNAQEFKVQLLFPESSKAELEQALQVFSFFGGLGSRSRNGFGSFQIKEFNVSEESIKNLFTNLKNTTNSLPEFPAFSSYSRLWITKPPIFNSWNDALAKLGKIYREARLSIEDKHSYKERIYLASPLIANKTEYSTLERYAKPYYLSIHKQDKEYFGTILYLPHQYAKGLDKDKKNKIINHEEEQNKANKVWNKVNDYFQEQENANAACNKVNEHFQNQQIILKEIK